MSRAGPKEEQRMRVLPMLLGASLLAGCQPEGTGSITVDRKNAAVRDFKTFEDVKRSKPNRVKMKPASTSSRPRAGFQ